MRESTRAADKHEAQQCLQSRLDQIGADRLGYQTFVAPSAEKVRLSEICEQLRRDMDLRGLRSLASTGNHLRQLERGLGHLRLKEITSEVVDQWVLSESEAGKAPSTINRRLQLLRQALTLAAERRMLPRVPRIRKLSELGRARRGFFEKDEFKAVLDELPADLQDFARFAYLTGWRKSAIASLIWTDVDMEARVIRLRPEHDKTGKGQVLALEGELWLILKRRLHARIAEDSRACLTVFHRQGAPVRSFQKSWASACRRAGCPGRLFHDLRRTAVRNLIRAGVPERVAMSISGHQTRDVFDRYNIVSIDDMREAQDRLQDHLKNQDRPRKVVSIR